MNSVDNFKQHFDLMEGVNDPSIFKAVFLAGGPGSGKSFVVGKTALQALGFRLINSDDAFEKGLKRAGLTTDPDDIASAQGQAVRAKAKALTGKIMTRALEGRMGIVIDGTGKDYAKIKKQVDMLRTLGYAVHMLFVNTDLDTALERNRMRPRSLPDDLVTKMWKDVQKNIGKFQGLFRNRMIVIDNSKGSDIEASTLEAYKDIKTWAAKAPENSIAVKWIKGQK
jgi:predicted kinase